MYNNLTISITKIMMMPIFFFRIKLSKQSLPGQGEMMMVCHWLPSDENVLNVLRTGPRVLSEFWSSITTSIYFTYIQEEERWRFTFVGKSKEISGNWIQVFCLSTLFKHQRQVIFCAFLKSQSNSFFLLLVKAKTLHYVKPPSLRIQISGNNFQCVQKS